MRYCLCFLLLLSALFHKKTTIFARMETSLMNLNKNKIFGYAALIMGLLGVAIIVLGILLYKEYIVGFGSVGAGFMAVAWTFNALRGRI